VWAAWWLIECFVRGKELFFALHYLSWGLYDVCASGRFGVMLNIIWYMRFVKL
jgi:hypothetical protein